MRLHAMLPVMRGVSTQRKILTSWNLKALREKLQATHDKADIDRAVTYMDSFDWKNKAALYHVNTADEVFSKYSGREDEDVKKMMHRLFSEKFDVEFETARRIREFSLVAAATTVHTLPEVLAQVITVSINPEIKNVHSISFNGVVKRITNPEYKSKLEALQGSFEYQYIHAFTNTIKHISLVKPKYNVGFDEQNYHGVVFDSFTFKDKDFESIRDEQLIEFINSIRTHCVKLGQDLNELVC